ncbi:MAG: tRNA epoxyqueuosine(34) reductase QueG [Candidatus Acidiferrales bacterium]
MDPGARTRWVCGQARQLGFDLCAVAPAEAFEELAHMPGWLENGNAGEMAYLWDARRTEPRKVMEGARSLIVVALNYNSPLPYSTEHAAVQDDGSVRGWISRYAWGDDYHGVLRDKLNTLVARMRECCFEPFEALAYVDTGPIVERVAAKYAGLGWLAKNTCLINQQLGSWLFLGVVITTLELAPSLLPGEPPVPDLCGNCTLCLDACPTQAFSAPYVLDARKCISYLTIELRGTIPEELRPMMSNAVFGCDICQDVCPWNRKSPMTQLAAFRPRQIAPNCDDMEEKTENGAKQGEATKNGTTESLSTLFAPELEWLASLTQEEFRKIFRGSAIKRAKWCGLVRNACVALGNSCPPSGSQSHRRIVRLLERLIASDDLLIAEHAGWALHKIKNEKQKHNATNPSVR